MPLSSLQNQQTTKGNVVLWVVFFVVIVGVIFAATRYSKKNPDAENVPGGVVAISEVTQDDHVIGALEAPIQFIEYSDFQCPFCGEYAPIIKLVLGEVGEDVVFAYRHRPLRSIHFNAQSAAEAAEAAGMQGKFFEMHDILFEQKDQWAEERNPTDLFIGYAEQIGLDIEQFKIDLDSREVRDRVNADLEEAIELGINSTPTLFINGQQLPSGLGAPEIITLINTLMTEPAAQDGGTMSDQGDTPAPVPDNEPGME